MRSETRLDSAVFRLTPTRTRCDLVIIAKGKTETIASGLVDPFLSHLRTAKDQITVGGYSIKLEPDPCAEASWFTKGTVERFVRFVSTPEVLERVITIESEIAQIDKAISIQGNDNIGLSTVEGNHQMKSIGSTEGNKLTFDPNAEKAIILYKPGSHFNPLESNESKMHGENSKIQLLRVLEGRKKVLQKEQAMAFARTAAAGFGIENLTHLKSFADSFGASRLMEACTRFMQLWKGKHETGQWIEVEAAEALSYRSEFSPLNSSGIILAGDSTRQKKLEETWPISGIDGGAECSGNTTGQDIDKDKKIPSEPQASRGPHEYFQGQFQYPPFPPWPVLSQPGPHGFQPYPMQVMPYPQNYSMNGQFFYPHPTTMEDPRFNTTKRKMKKKHLINNKDSIALEDGSDESSSEYEEESSKSHHSHHKSGHSKKKKGVAAIQNLNYIEGNKHEASENGSESFNESENIENKDSLSDNGEHKQRSLKHFMKRDNQTKSSDISNLHERNDEIFSEQTDGGNWEAFQSFLLRAEEKKTSVISEDIMAGEKEPPVIKGQLKSEPYLTFLPERGSSNYPGESMMEYGVISGKGSRSKQVVSADEVLISSADRCLQVTETATHFKEIDGRVRYQKGTSDEMSSLHSSKDESFMVPFRLGSQDLLGVDRRLTIDVDSSNKETARVTYEPDDLALMLGRRQESESAGYRPATDFDIQAPPKSENKKDNNFARTNEGLIKTVREKKLKSTQSGLENKRKDAITEKMTSLRSTSLTEAQKRAENLRSYKSDLQKMKKEHEEGEMKRLEALKRERQRRIAARSSSNPVQSPAMPQQHKPRLPVKLTPNSHKSSKFTDSEPRSNSHLQRLPRNIGSVGSNDSNKVPKATRSNGFSHLTSSLPQDSRSTSEQIRRLSEPKGKEDAKKTGIPASERIRRLSEPKVTITRKVPEKLVKSPIQVTKRPLVEEHQSKKISAIIQLDRTKSETLPELKIKTYRTPLEAAKVKPAAKQQKVAGSTSSLIPEMKIEKTHSFSYSDENPVVEKAVVILENEVVSAPSVQTLEGKIDSVNKLYRDGRRNMNGEDTGCTSIQALPTPIYGVEVESSTDGRPDDRPNSHEIANHRSKNESESFLNSTAAEKPYRTPYTRVSSLEKPAADICSVDQLDETQEKAQSKESKGLRKLWKFGRKGHSSVSGDCNFNLNGSVDNQMICTSQFGNSSTLKNLISKDESNVAGSQEKVSSPFFILAPFRGRSKEKKVAG